MSKFANAPYYMKSDFVFARFAEVDQVVQANIASPSGSRIVDLEAPARHWLVFPANGDDPFVASEGAFQAEHISLPGVDAGYVTRGRPFRAIFHRGRIHVENDFESRDPKSFFASVARLDAERRPVTHASMPLAMQATLLKGPNAIGHVEAIKQWRAHLGGQLLLEPSVAADLTAFDIITSGRKDVVSDTMASIYGGVIPNGLKPFEEDNRFMTLKEDSVLGALVMGTEIPPFAFKEIRHTPTYQVESFRALGRRLLAPFIGDYPMEDVIVFATAIDAVNPVAKWAQEGELVEETTGVALDELPGYVTSDFRHYRRDGVDVLCFEDTSGRYSYAWPTPPRPTMAP